MHSLVRSLDCSLDHGPAIEAACWTLASSATVIVAARFICHRCIVEKMCWSDYWMLLALVRGCSL